MSCQICLAMFVTETDSPAFPPSSRSCIQECGHTFCRECIQRWAVMCMTPSTIEEVLERAEQQEEQKGGLEPTCPICKTGFRFIVTNKGQEPVSTREHPVPRLVRSFKYCLLSLYSPYGENKVGGVEEGGEEKTQNEQLVRLYVKANKGEAWTRTKLSAMEERQAKLMAERVAEAIYWSVIKEARNVLNGGGGSRKKKTVAAHHV